jgi:hypothetical protein
MRFEYETLIYEKQPRTTEFFYHILGRQCFPLQCIARVKVDFFEIRHMLDATWTVVHADICATCIRPNVPHAHSMESKFWIHSMASDANDLKWRRTSSTVLTICVQGKQLRMLFLCVTYSLLSSSAYGI